jgi:hypothetical protein
MPENKCFQGVLDSCNSGCCPVAKGLSTFQKGPWSMQLYPTYMHIYIQFYYFLGMYFFIYIYIYIYVLRIGDCLMNQWSTSTTMNKYWPFHHHYLFNASTKWIMKSYPFFRFLIYLFLIVCYFSVDILKQLSMDLISPSDFQIRILN